MLIRASGVGRTANRRDAIVLSIAAMVVVASIAGPGLALAEPPPAEEEAAVVVGEDETVVSEEGDAQTGGDWNARQITLRNVGNKAAFIRQSSEAFDDPDKRLSLELKYYFELPKDIAAEVAHPTAGALSRGAKVDPGAKLIAGPQSSTERFDIPLPQLLNSRAGEPENDVEWLDYQAGDAAKVIAALLAGNDLLAGRRSPALVVARVSRQEMDLALDKQLAVRELKAAELPAGCQQGGLLDTWDRPKSLGSRAMFLGRVIAVLKLVDDRFAVDFYGEALNPDSDCRVWLWKKGTIGRPIGIRFVEIPVKKGPDAVGSTWALAVAIAGDDPEIRTIAFDYPLCRPAIMEQMQRALQQKPGGGGPPPPDLEKLVGADLLDEFARRLVNGTYR